MHWLAYIIMMVADALVLNWCKGIIMHHANTTLNLMSYDHSMQFVLHYSSWRNHAWGMLGSATSQFLCYWWPGTRASPGLILTQFWLCRHMCMSCNSYHITVVEYTLFEGCWEISSQSASLLLGVHLLIMIYITVISHGCALSQISSQLPLSLTVCSQSNIKEASKVCITGPLWGESTSDWWIPLTKVQ